MTNPSLQPVFPPKPDPWFALLLAFVLSLAGTLGSLFFSEVMKLPPCALCWYQRVALYPLVLVFGIGYWDRDGRCLRYGWPMVILGMITALYHVLLYYGVIPESISPCTQGVPCTTRQLDWFGFISIPSLSFFGFFSVAVCLLVFQTRLKKDLTS